MLNFKAIGYLPECTARFVRLERFRAALGQADVRSAVWIQQIPLTSSPKHALHEFGHKFSAVPNTGSAPAVGCDSYPYVFASLKLIRLRLPSSLSVSLRSTESSINLHCGIKLNRKICVSIASYLLSHLIRFTWISSEEMVFHAPDKYSRQIRVATSLISDWDLVAWFFEGREL